MGRWCAPWGHSLTAGWVRRIGEISLLLCAFVAFGLAWAAGAEQQERRGTNTAAKTDEAGVDARLLADLEILRDLELLRQLDILRRVEEVRGEARSPASREEKGKP